MLQDRQRSAECEGMAAGGSPVRRLILVARMCCKNKTDFKEAL